MRTVNISLSNTNYTEQAAMDIRLESREFELLKMLLHKIEDGLYSEGENYLAFDGLLNEPVQLTVTAYDQSAP
jgi:hypothetical protein